MTLLTEAGHPYVADMDFLSFAALSDSHFRVHSRIMLEWTWANFVSSQAAQKDVKEFTKQWNPKARKKGAAEFFRDFGKAGF